MNFQDRKRLETVIARARGEANSPHLSDENKAWLAQLMTIWASGYLEATCRDVMLEYTKKRANPNIVKYVSRKLNRFRNPKMNNILILIREFDEEFANRLDEFSAGQIKENVDSIVGVRHQIAHGRSANISVGRITGYFDNVKKLAKKMEEILQ